MLGEDAQGLAPGGHEQVRALAQTNGLRRLQTQNSQTLAVIRPRDDLLVIERAEKEAKRLGAIAYYRWGTGKDMVQGVSVKLAMALARVYGNCETSVGLVADEPDAWVFDAVFHDQETGFTLRRPFRQAKGWTVYGKFDEARKADIRFQIGASKATRNVLLNALPEWLVAKAVDAAMGGIRESIEAAIGQHGLEAVQARAVAALGRYASPDRVLAALGRKVPAQLDIDDLIQLKSALAAIETGAEEADTLFPPLVVKATAASVADKLDATFGGVPQGPQEAATPPAAAPAPAPAEPAPTPPKAPRRGKAAAPQPAPEQDGASFLAQLDSV